MQGIVAAAVPEVTEHDHAVLPVLQDASAHSEKVCQPDDEVTVARYVREIPRIIAVASYQAVADPLTAHLVVGLLVENHPVRRAGNNEVNGVGRQITDESTRVAKLDQLSSLGQRGLRDLRPEPLLGQLGESLVEFHADAVAVLERAGLERRAHADEGVENRHPSFGEQADQAGDIGEGKRRRMFTLDLRVGVVGAKPLLRPHADAVAHPLPGAEVVELVARRYVRSLVLRSVTARGRQRRNGVADHVWLAACAGGHEASDQTVRRRARPVMAANYRSSAFRQKEARTGAVIWIPGLQTLRDA